MQLKEAIKKAEKKGKEKGYLASVFVVPKNGKITEWTLLFYNSSGNSVTDCSVNDSFVTLGETMPAQSKMKPLDVEKIKLGPEEAAEAAKKDYDKNIRTMMLSLHTQEYVIWSVTFIGDDLTVTRIDIHAGTGKIMDKKTTSVIRKL